MKAGIDYMGAEGVEGRKFVRAPTHPFINLNRFPVKTHQGPEKRLLNNHSK
jgi:hypothetical protein